MPGNSKDIKDNKDSPKRYTYKLRNRNIKQKNLNKKCHKDSDSDSDTSSDYDPKEDKVEDMNPRELQRFIQKI